jgi:hypothetical protein
VIYPPVNTTPDPLITISQAQINGFIAIASNQLGLQTGLMAQYMGYGDKGAKPLYEKLVFVNTTLKNLTYNVPEIPALVTFLIPNNSNITSVSVSVPTYGTIGTTTWQGSPTATAANVVAEINLGGIFTAYNVLGYVVVNAPAGHGSTFNGTIATVSVITVTNNTSAISSEYIVTGGINGSFTVTFNTPGYFGNTFSYTSSLPAAEAAVENVMAQVLADNKGFTFNIIFCSINAPASYGTIPNNSWYTVFSGSYIIDGGGVDNYFVGGAYGTPVTTTSHYTFTQGLTATTFCLNYQQIFTMMEFISNALGFYYDINQTPSLT